MALHPGLSLGPYEIQSPLGAGGMGEIYKARDTRLGRVVAIKILPGAVAADPQLRERFDREAKVISSLNHPHICALYDVGSQEGIDFLVMEYLDGETLADRMDLYQTFFTGQQREEPLVISPLAKFPMDWSADGRFLLYDVLDMKQGFDVWALPLGGDRKPFPVVETEFNEGLSQFSPDGHWIAYQSDWTGRPDVYVRPFPGAGADVRVSVDGGAQVRWNPNGKELFYVAADNRLMAVPIRFASGSTSPELGTPIALFKTILSSAAGPMYKQQYMVSPDGQSFVMHSAVGEASASPITVILNGKPRASK